MGVRPLRRLNTHPKPEATCTVKPRIPFVRALFSQVVLYRSFFNSILKPHSGSHSFDTSTLCVSER